MPDTDILIVGGGLAGSTAAIHLARAGHAVVLLEKSTGPHDKVCGEFLSGEALHEIRLLGVDPAGLGGVPLDRVRTAARGEPGEAGLPFEAISLSRRTLDEALLTLALAEGVEVRRRETAVAVAAGKVATRGGAEISARHVLVASGKHDVRGLRRPRGLHDDMLGVKSYFPAPGPNASDLRGSIDIVFFPGGYCGFQLVEDGRMNACAALEKNLLGEVGGRPEALFGHIAETCPHAARLLGDSQPTSAPVTVGRVPYGMVRRETDGPFYLGDQAAVIPSFCGEGMGLALRSGRLAAEAIGAGRTAEDYQAAFAAMAGPRVRAAALLSRVLALPLAQKAAARTARAAPRLVSLLAAGTRTPLGTSRRAFARR